MTVTYSRYYVETDKFTGRVRTSIAGIHADSTRVVVLNCVTLGRNLTSVRRPKIATCNTRDTATIIDLDATSE